MEVRFSHNGQFMQTLIGKGGSGQSGGSASIRDDLMIIGRNTVF